MPEAELAPLLDYVKSRAHQADAEAPVWDGPAFLGAFASGRNDVSKRADELLFAEYPTSEPTQK